MSDWRNALRISGILYLVYAVPTLVLTLLFPVPTQPADLAAAGGGVAATGLITGILYLVAFLWLAVAWHRYILLDEMPTGLLPEFNGSRMLSYFGYSLLIGLVLIGLAIVMGIITGIVGAVIGQLAIVIVLVFYFLMLIASYRLSPMLPAAAVGVFAFLGLLWQLAAGWVTMVVGVSLLTTIYGHYVEGRPLSTG